MSFVVVATTLRIGLVVILVSLAGGAADPRHHAVDPAALDGCRAPDEPGCASCCVDTDGGRCRYQIGDEDWALYDVAPWYNGVAFVDGACPDDCPRCARCSARDEHLLETLAPRPDCACDGLEPGVDPCYSPDSCACYCHSLASLTAMCPAEPLG